MTDAWLGNDNPFGVGNAEVAGRRRSKPSQSRGASAWPEVTESGVCVTTP